MKNLFLFVIVTILIAQAYVHADAATFAAQNQTFASQSNQQNGVIKTEAVVQKNNGANASFSTISTLVKNKQTLGKKSRPKALTIEDRIKKYTATIIEQKKKSGQSNPQLTSADVQHIQTMALLSQNQRG